MLVLFFHLLAGLLTGALFGVQTLLLVVFLVLIEAVCGLVGRVPMGIGQWLAAGIVLQVGYLGGIFMRSVLERFTASTKLRTSGRI